MNEDELWIYLDGPEPERIRPMLDALRDLPPLTPAECERLEREFFARLDVMLGIEPDVEPPPRVEAPAEPSALASDTRALWARASLLVAEPSDPAPTAPPPPLPPAHGDRAPPAGGPPAAVDLRATMPLSDDPQRVSPLPFRSPGELPPRPAPPPVAKTKEMPVMRGPGETIGVGDDSLSRAVAAIPFPGSTAAGDLVHFPRFLLQEYASFCAEIAVIGVDPKKLPEIRTRYGVLTPLAHRALDDHWKEILAGSPETRAIFEPLLAQFVAWLRLGHPAGNRR